MSTEEGACVDGFEEGVDGGGGLCRQKWVVVSTALKKVSTEEGGCVDGFEEGVDGGGGLRRQKRMLVLTALKNVSTEEGACVDGFQVTRWEPFGFWSALAGRPVFQHWSSGTLIRADQV